MVSNGMALVVIQGLIVLQGLHREHFGNEDRAIAVQAVTIEKRIVVFLGWLLGIAMEITKLRRTVVGTYVLVALTWDQVIVVVGYVITLVSIVAIVTRSSKEGIHSRYFVRLRSTEHGDVPYDISFLPPIFSIYKVLARLNQVLIVVF